jgi:hypothetical protein
MHTRDVALTKEQLMEIDPKQDGPGQRQKLKQAVIGLIDSMGTYRNCITCTWFDEQRVICTEKTHNGLTPPPRIVAYGCDDHSDLIPF